MPQVNPIIKRGLQDKVLAAILEGTPHVQIATELGVSRGAVAAYAKKISNPAQSLQSRQDVKGAIRLEISQENALSDLADQMKEYSDRYEKAIKDDDMKAAYAWSARRVDLLEKMLKVTGLYDGKAALPSGADGTDRGPGEMCRNCPYKSREKLLEFLEGESSETKEEAHGN